MNTSSFWRNAAIALVLANALFALWSGGYLGFVGLDPNPQREAQRLDEQVAPEAVQIKPAGDALTSQPASAPASASASASAGLD